ncbi:hypothetical protein DBV14_05835 [Variovorax sp. KBW07]|uniref:lipase family protein n=1 Tax=Variovorax sp. KBW07 TaxID=2153358 RepID=UPI000F56A115|nr:lipase family protein [Variovorax sp. KBW07]RQO61028.1 hypothetical protein DBV14_05835 [Variovorax sp. KBW07]
MIYSLARGADLAATLRACWLRLTWALAALALLGIWSPPVMAGPLDDPRNDAFYTPPAQLPPGPHGTLIRSRPFVPVGLLVSGWQIMYKSTDASGNAVAITGTVLVPWTPWFGGNRPLIAWATGTQGMADNCAPSHQYAVGTEYEVLLGAPASTLARGWAIAMTDYQGMGTPGDQPYLVGRSEGQAVLDAALAAQQLPAANLSANAPVGIMGYSQGGHASAWAAELQPSYAPTLKVKGVAAGAGPARIDGTFYSQNNGSLFGGAMIYILMGMNAAYPELDLPSILTSYGQHLVADARDKKCFIEMEASYPGTSDAVLVNPPGILDRPDWKARLAQNRTGSVAPAVPALVYAGLLDEVVPYPVAKQLFTDWCAAGAKVSFRTIGITEHISGMALGWPLALGWMSDRFAGESAPSDCP